MPFPDSPRVIYNINPLDQVICQLRFPPILSIDKKIPYEFQEFIRNEYPLYFEEKELLNGAPLEVFSQISHDSTRDLLLQSTEKMNYRFDSADGDWAIHLTNNFIALIAKKYDRWENFVSHLELPLRAFEEIYHPLFYSRIGLRYIDVIQRSKLNLEKSDWTDLIQPYILGILAANNIDKSIVKNSLGTDEIFLDDNKGLVRIVHGLVISKQNNETVYIIDSDYFTEKQTETQDALSKLNEFNHKGRRLFRWCITDFLHGALQPESL